MNAPCVSVVIAVYNGAAFISRAIDSVLSQTFEDFELIIVDDGSTDDTKKVVVDKAKVDSRIRLIENRENRGLVYTRNELLQASSGKYVVVLDADDTCYPNRLAVQVAFMERNSEIGLCGADFIKLFADGSTGLWDFPEDDAQIRRRMFWGVGHLNSSVIMRRSVIVDNAIAYSEDFPVSEDYKLFFDIGKFSKLHNLKQTLGEYYYHAGQQTSTRKELLGRCSTKIMAEHFNLLGIEVSDADFELLYRLYNFNFLFDADELNRIAILFSRFIERNKVEQLIPDLGIEYDIAERYFECCYFSHDSKSFACFTRSPFARIYSPGIVKLSKFRLRKLIGSK